MDLTLTTIFAALILIAAATAKYFNDRDKILTVARMEKILDKYFDNHIKIDHVPQSKETGGALHISKEGLDKLTALSTHFKETEHRWEIKFETLMKDNLTKSMHTLICDSNTSKTKDELKEHIDAKLEKLEASIIREIKKNNGK